jgi:hypothetical protein
VLDASGDEDVVEALGRAKWTSSPTFLSLSLGFEAKRSYFFLANTHTFPVASFRSLLRPYLEMERESIRAAGLPREGVGCWHPVFPAGPHDVQSAAATGLRILEDNLKLQPRAQLQVFEHVEDSAGYAGVQRVATHDAP